ncbi:FkbM family methyltransferase [Streptomyces sp. NPDC020883]|uniref:FkbM family methyltransferase n=1 Tax=Streptomyces sp. NPDC020883 TaxID=3365099 RepID=UPI0037B7E334
MACHPDAPGNSGLYADREADGESSRTFLRNRGPDDSSIADVLDGAHVGETIEVAVTTVSDIFREHGSPDIALLKTDVERAGMDALRGIHEEDWSRIHGICRKRIRAAAGCPPRPPAGRGWPGRRMVFSTAASVGPGSSCSARSTSGARPEGTRTRRWQKGLTRRTPAFPLPAAHLCQVPGRGRPG